ncbi:HotDog domain-containing protein [Chlamydoabsidia padenii]|nr:HotDog domain-containing protein [Chlamydoabsidia padenii]
MKFNPTITDAHPELSEMIHFYNQKHNDVCWDDLISKDLTLVEVAPGKLVWELVVHESHCNQLGNLHGGCVATLIDVCTSFATLVSDRKAHWKNMGVSTDLAVSYMLGVPAGETIRIECQVQRVGKNLANLHSIIYNSAGKTCYSGSHTKFCINSKM